jgi:hypothetical protein
VGVTGGSLGLAVAYVPGEETKMTIAVTCRSNSQRSAQEQFDAFALGLELNGVTLHKLGQYIQIGKHLTFRRVTTTFEIRGQTFDGVVRLSELFPQVEQELIAALIPPLSL